MRKLSRTTVRASLGTLAVGGLLAAGAVAATGNSNSVARSASGSQVVAPLATVPAATDFAVLRQPPASGRSVPSRVADAAADPEVAAKFGPNAAAAHAVHPNGDAAVTWYVMAGPNSLCLATTNGGSCGPLGRSEAGEFYVTQGSQPSEVMGVAPDSIASVTATTANGTVTETVVDNVYDVSGPHISAITLNGVGAAARTFLIAPVGGP